jgi:hypothetical protein
MRVIRRRFLSLAVAWAAAPFALRLARSQVEAPSTSGRAPFVFPGAQWEAASPVKLGWSIQGLAEAYQLFATVPPASMVVVDRGQIVVAWGDSARQVKLSSIRKSFRGYRAMDLERFGLRLVLGHISRQQRAARGAHRLLFCPFSRGRRSRGKRRLPRGNFGLVVSDYDACCSARSRALTRMAVVGRRSFSLNDKAVDAPALIVGERPMAAPQSGRDVSAARPSRFELPAPYPSRLACRKAPATNVDLRLKAAGDGPTNALTGLGSCRPMPGLRPRA